MLILQMVIAKDLWEIGSILIEKVSLMVLMM
jgi:hypothetical protein